jgi:uncharacterized protein YjbI with pentapeptide repeats
MSIKITTQRLEDHNACSLAIDRFEYHFPRKTLTIKEWTLEHQLMLLSSEFRIHFSWLVENCFIPQWSMRNVDFSDQYLVGADFSNSDLTGANFSRANLFRANFKKCDIANAKFDHANCTGVFLRYSRSGSATFYETEFNSAYFYDCDLPRLRHAKLANATMVDSKVPIGWKVLPHGLVVPENPENPDTGVFAA